MRPDRVLFVHGWWAGAWVWSRFEPVFQARGFETTAIDLPLPAPGRSLDARASPIISRRCAVRQMSWVGLWSWATSADGLLALRLAEERALPACVALAPAAPRGVMALVS